MRIDRAVLHVTKEWLLGLCTLLLLAALAVVLVGELYLTVRAIEGAVWARYGLALEVLMVFVGRVVFVARYSRL